MEFSIGVDCGSNSVRALVVRCSDGAELGSYVVDYNRKDEGLFLLLDEHDFARQYSCDDLSDLEISVLGALAEAFKKKEFSTELIVSIGVDTTNASPEIDFVNALNAVDRINEIISNIINIQNSIGSFLYLKRYILKRNDS